MELQDLCSVVLVLPEDLENNRTVVSIVKLLIESILASILDVNVELHESVHSKVFDDLAAFSQLIDKSFLSISHNYGRNKFKRFSFGVRVRNYPV